MKQRIHHRFPFLGARAGFLTCMLCLPGFSLPAQVNVPDDDPYPDWVVQRIREAEGQAAVQQVLLDLAEAMVPQPARSEDSLTRFRLTADARPLSQPFPALWENWPRPGGSLEQRDTYLIRIPEWLEATSLVEGTGGKKLPLFASGITAVRPFGGWKSNRFYRGIPGREDMIYRASDGTIQYHWEYIARRFDEFVENEISLTVVFDNVPEVFVSNPEVKTYGQARAPDSIEEYVAFIGEFLDRCIERYGRETVENWSFRFATEPNWGRYEPFTQKYEPTYRQLSDLVSKKLPRAEFGPGNLVIPWLAYPNLEKMGKAYIDAIDVFQRLSADAKSLRCDFLPCSYYWHRDFPDGPNTLFMNPETIRLAAALLVPIRRMHPKWNDLPLEIHEFAIMGNDYSGPQRKLYGSSREPGIRGAAWHVHAYGAGFEAGFTKLNTWGNFEFLDYLASDRAGRGRGYDHTIPRADYLKPILSGEAWVQGVLRNMVGADYYPMEISSNRHRDGVRFKSYLLRSEERALIAVSCFNHNRKEVSTEQVRMTMPVSLLPGGVFDPDALSQVSMDHATSPYETAQRMLHEAKILQSPPGYIYRIGKMTGVDGTRYLAEHYEPIQEQMVRAFTPRPFVGRVDTQGEEVLFELKMKTPSVAFLLFGDW